MKYVRCTVCDFDFVVSHGGRDDVERHVSSGRHKAEAEAIDKSAMMMKFLTR